MKKSILTFAIFIIILSTIYGIFIYLNQNHGFFIISSQNLNETYVSLRFDDALKSQKEAFELLKKYNFTGSVYVSTKKPESGNEWEKSYYLSWNEIKEISSFMEIGSHSKSHRDLTKIKDYTNEVIESKEKLQKEGYESSTFVYPGGNYNRQIIKVVEQNYKCASTQDVGTNSLPTKPHLLKDFTLRSYNDIETIKRVIKKNSWTILTFHDIGDITANNMSLAYKTVAESNKIDLYFLEDILRYLKENNIKVITIAEGCDKIAYT
jgi:peptidoglycan/xylan/chitin deacetylase (PgdA/CDA1 family)